MADWWDLTYRELFHAAEAKRLADWQHTAALSANIVNAWITKAVPPDFFNPLAETYGKIPAGLLDDPGREYDRLQREKQRRSRKPGGGM